MYAAYQCVEVIGEFVIAASAHTLQTFNLFDGSQISSWACPDQLNKTALATQSEPPNDEDGLQGSGALSIEATGSDSNQPAKRRKLSDPSNEESSSVGRAPKGENPRACSQRTTTKTSIYPNIVALTSSNDGKYVIIVTGEDKTIRVLRHDGGHLQQISERSMPKRPCAVTLSPSGSAIICADKFGDVYSLPLLMDLPEGQDATTAPLVEDENLSEKPKQFVSSANDLTVHSARNRRALQNQLKQNLAKADKVEANVGQQLLLGHVSMLTDIALVEECGRNYIITADRDEHIRVSRGIPQSHIIEAYCLGHSEFVSRLCLPKSANRLLISGGGDDDLFVWDWLSGDLLQKVNISSHVELVLRGSSGEGLGVGIGANDDSHSPKVIVSGIKHLQQEPNSNSGSVVVTCEGVPALFFFELSPAGNLSHYQTLPLNGNPLAMATIVQNNTLIVSVDLWHCPGSVVQLRDVETIGAEVPLKVIKSDGKDWNTVASHFGKVDITGVDHQTMPAANVDWWNVLYNLGNLRKRAGWE
ncbi:tRNA (guanine-N(7)-)-methyltransferase non-catalytic subunit trm82 [Pseudogymnoascus verrucosus]|uniref:tRNA (Guanine-N(7)-)-methyltransferase non-catalytic subunit trm82 n=1 Tax=Pseudogymnoascus verrucosus TaxID=342668 RepID=A0A1B8G8G7_9PEZI|nr:tRNA (guanine-N(7)-)-methyltransferase non-catalytic subunit trm82 [Pseudogymnoascus verrucosus]OBT92126.1 tRNA (guanine-N(7)-)-methyltransferase non-catalytic subunit trm82 [Pseudogymnoascus verrucosus]